MAKEIAKEIAKRYKLQIEVTLRAAKAYSEGALRAAKAYSEGALRAAKAYSEGANFDPFQSLNSGFDLISTLLFFYL